MLFPDKPGPEVPAPGTRPGVTAQERGKIVFLGVALLAVLGGLVAAAVGARDGASETPPPAAPRAPEDGPLGPPGVPVGPGEGEMQIVPLFPDEMAEVVQERLRERMATAGAVADGIAAEDGVAYEALLEAVTTDHRVLNLTGEGFAVDPDPATLLDQPERHRGDLVRYSGELLALERLPYSGPNPLVKEVRRGVLRTAAGRLVGFSHGVASPHEPVAVEAGDGWVRVRGAFYKQWPVADGAPGAAPVPAPHLLLTAAPVRDYPPVALREVDPRWAGDVKDSTGAEMVVRDEPPFFLLLNMLRTLGEKGFEEWVRAQPAAPGKEPWPPEDFTNRSHEFLKAPALHRFRPVTIKGYLKQPKFVYDMRPNQGNCEKLWLGFVVADDLVPVWVYRERSFLGDGMKEGSYVHVEGIFYKQVAYDPRGGGGMKRGPVVLASSVRPLPVRKLSVSSEVLYAGVAALAIMLALLGAVVVRARRDERSSAAMWRERVSKRQKQRQKASAGDDAPAPPA
jgi:hypothetical protein